MPRPSEDALLSGLRRRLARHGHRRLGDDAAILPGGASSWAVTVDQQIEGVHFPTGSPPRSWAHRLVAVCLSDVAAMGGRPLFAFLALQASAGLDCETVLAAVADRCAEHGVELAGGDIAADCRSGASLTLLARPTPGGRWLLRSAARAGDQLWLGGALGWSRLGRDLLEPATFASLPPRLRHNGALARRRHAEPRPQLALGAALAHRRRCAAIDISDGLALDLHRLCEESGVGAIVERAALPLPPTELAEALGHDALDCALHGGEDYVLLFALPAGRRPPAGHAAVRIGSITEASGLQLATVEGPVVPLAPCGWDHLREQAQPPR